MATKITLKTTIIPRKDTAANWTSSTSIPALGEFCLDTTNNILKCGDGTHTFNNLPALNDKDLSDLGITATAAEINKLDGLTATTAELNYVDGVTSNIQTQLNNKAANSHTHSSYVNQNAFSNVVVGSTTIAADTTTDTLTLVAGSNITLTPDATNDKVTIAATDTKYSAATGSTLGLVKVGYTESGKNYPVELNDSNQMFVNVPWTDTNTTYTAATTSNAGLMSAADKSKLDGIASGANNYTYTLPKATTSALGGVMIGYEENGKNYPVELDTSGKMYVNVPWTDNNTVYTHPTYTSKASGLYKITVDGTGHVSAATAVTKSDITALGIPSTNTTYSVATTSANGLMSSTDKSHVDSMWSIWSADGTTDTLVNKVQEVLTVFENYPEGDNLVEILADKSAIGHTHSVPAPTVTVTGASYTPAGTVSKITPAGTISTGTGTANYTPAGTVSTTLNTTSVNSITDVGTLPSLTVTSTATSQITSWSAGSVPTRASFTYGKGDVTASFANGVLTITSNGTGSAYSITGVGAAPSLSYDSVSVGSASGWSAGKLPTKGSATTVATSVKSSTFTGTGAQLVFTGTAVTPTFSGTAATIKPSVSVAATTTGGSTT